MKTIKFVPATTAVLGAIPAPIPAAKLLPDWYRQQPSATHGHTRMESNGKANATVKKCMPVLDDITAGYLFLLPCDVQFEKTDAHNYNVTWSMDIAGIPERGIESIGDPVVTSHAPEQVSHYQINEEFHHQVWKFTNYYRVLTPPGYSCMFRHPSWRPELPFVTFSGLVDTDRHPVEVNLPFLLRGNFEGIIPAGTPICQIIPFKRQEWQSVVVEEPNYDGANEFRNSTRKMMHRYKDNWRAVKSWR